MRKLRRWASRFQRAAAITALALYCGPCAQGFAAGETPKPPAGRLGEELFSFGKKGIGPSQLTWVQSVALDGDGFLYLGDWDLGRVQRFSPDGKIDRVVYVEPHHIDALAYERSGVLFVVASDHMYRYDAKTLRLLGEVERPSHGDFVAVAARPEGGVIAVLEAPGITDDIAFLDKDGKIERTLHSAIDKVADYTVRDPHVAVDAKGYFYIGDNGNYAVFKFTPEGRYINRFGYAGHPPGDSQTDIHGLTVDRQGQLWISGWSTLNLVASDGRALQAYDMSAYGLAVNDKNELYVTDRTQVRRYALAKP